MLEWIWAFLIWLQIFSRHKYNIYDVYVCKYHIIVYWTIKFIINYFLKRENYCLYYNCEVIKQLNTNIIKNLYRGKNNILNMEDNFFEECNVIFYYRIKKKR